MAQNRAFSLGGIGSPCCCSGTTPPFNIGCGVCGGIHLTSGTISDGNGTWTWAWDPVLNWFWVVPTYSYIVAGWNNTVDINNCCSINSSFPQYYGYTLVCDPPNLDLNVYTWWEPVNCNPSPPCPAFPVSANIPVGTFVPPQTSTDLPNGGVASATATPTCTGGTRLTASFSWTWAIGVLPAAATSATVTFTITTP